MTAITTTTNNHSSRRDSPVKGLARRRTRVVVLNKCVCGTNDCCYVCPRTSQSRGTLYPVGITRRAGKLNHVSIGDLGEWQQVGHCEADVIGPSRTNPDFVSRLSVPRITRSHGEAIEGIIRE